MQSKALKVMLRIAGIGLLTFLGYWIFVSAIFGGFDKDYSVTELKENFEKNKKEIYELKQYFKAIVPESRFVEIEFENDKALARIGIKHLETDAGAPSSKPMSYQWGLKINAAQTNSIIESIGWTRETLKELKRKLDRANCISIESGEPAKIGFKRSGMGIYSFNVFDERNADDWLQQQLYDSCSYILVNEKLVLEYNGGAIGNKCFYNLK